MGRNLTFQDQLTGCEIVTWRRLSMVVPYSRQYIWKMEQDGSFPKRISFGPKRSAWKVQEIKEWLAERGIKSTLS
jgi:prophage regulatory protein